MEEQPTIAPHIDLRRRPLSGERLGLPKEMRQPGWSQSLAWEEFSFEINLHLESAADNDPESRRNAVHLAALAALSFAETLASTFQANAERIASSLPDRAGATQWPPFLPVEGRQIHFVNTFDAGNLPKTIDFEKPLAGQYAEHKIPLGSLFIAALFPSLVPGSTENIFEALRAMPRGRAGYQFSFAPLVSFQIVALGFEEGSLWSWLKTNAQVLALAAPLLGVPPIPQMIGDWYHHMQAHTAHTVALQQAIPADGMTPTYSPDRLREAGEDALNYEAPRLSISERQYRIALVQYALRVALQTHLEMDGKLGPDTMEHIKEFARRRNVPPTIRSRLFRAELLKTLISVGS